MHVSASPLGRMRRGLAGVVLCVAVIGGVAQTVRIVGFTREARYDRPADSSLEAFLAIARDRMPFGVVFANTPDHAEAVRYGLYPRIERHVRLTGDEDQVKRDLARAGATYVVITDDSETVFTGTSGTWWREMLRQEDMRVIELHP